MNHEQVRNTLFPYGGWFDSHGIKMAGGYDAVSMMYAPTYRQIGYTLESLIPYDRNSGYMPGFQVFALSLILE